MNKEANEKKAKELAGFQEGVNPIPTQRFVFDKCVEMAEWKDKQLEKAIARETFAVQIFDGRWISVVSVQRLKQTLKEL